MKIHQKKVHRMKRNINDSALLQIYYDRIIVFF
jgi:hypothetical protein